MVARFGIAHPRPDLLNNASAFVTEDNRFRIRTIPLDVV
jgi:hypothetical protein